MAFSLGPHRLPGPGQRGGRSVGCAQRDRGAHSTVATRTAGHATVAPTRAEARPRDGNPRPPQRWKAHFRRGIGKSLRIGAVWRGGGRSRARPSSGRQAGATERVLERGVRAAPASASRVPVWVAAVWPHRRPVRRAVRWDGLFPIDLPDPTALAELAGEIERDRAAVFPGSTWSSSSARATTRLRGMTPVQPGCSRRSACNRGWLRCARRSRGVHDELGTLCRRQPGTRRIGTRALRAPGTVHVGNYSA